jgi:hypothetical protein
MMTKTPALSLLGVLSILWLAVAASPAAALVLSLDVFFSGPPTTAVAPFGTVAINPIAGGMEFVLTNLTPGTLSGGSSKMDGVYLNYKGSQALTPQAAPPGTTLGYATNAYKADGDGWYDILFEYAGNGYLPTNSSVTFSILGDSDALNFVDFSLPGGNNGVYLAASHIQSTTPNGDSFWAGANEVVRPVPEPAGLLLFGAGAAVMGAMRSRRKG